MKALREAHPEIEKTVSATTRAPRPGEQEGVDYYYRTREQFQPVSYTHLASVVAALELLSTKRAARLPKKHGNMAL